MSPIIHIHARYRYSYLPIEAGSFEVQEAQDSHDDNRRHGIHGHVLKDGGEPDECAPHHERHYHVVQTCRWQPSGGLGWERRLTDRSIPAMLTTMLACLAAHSFVKRLH